MSMILFAILVSKHGDGTYQSSEEKANYWHIILYPAKISVSVKAK